MPNLARVRVTWTGSPVVGGGLSTFYFDEAHEGYVADLVAFFDAIDGGFPIGLSISVPGSGDLIDVATGELSGTWTELGAQTIPGTNNGNFVQGTGARVVWNTDGITNGRRVKGSTFLAPIAAANFEGSSALTAGFIGTIQTAATALVAASGTSMRIYTQPRPGTTGAQSTVTSATVPDKTSWLRSRRV